MRGSSIAAVSCLSIFSVSGQYLYFGAVAGTNLTENFPNFQQSAPMDQFGNPAYSFAHFSGPASLILGALAEWQISNGFSIEADALHRPLTDVVSDTTFPVGASPSTSRLPFTRTTWEFPAMLKYTWPAMWSGARPFLEGGPSLRSLENAGAAQPSRLGWTGGLGVAWQLGRFRVAPTLRYTRWDTDNAAPKYPTKQDQVEFLTSFAYGTESETRRFRKHQVEIGAVAGYPVTRGFGPFYGSPVPEKIRFEAGASVTTKIAGNFSLEADAIYKPLRSDDFTVITWDFPVLAKYTWKRSGWSPFVEAGPSFRAAGNLNGYNPSHLGVTAGGGIERRMGGFLLSPAARYTRWAADASYFPVPAGDPYLKTNANTVQLLFGVAF